MTNICVWNSGLTDLKKAKLELALKVGSGRILDLGSGDNPFAYAFPYISKIESLTLSDNNNDVIANLNHKINNLDPDDLNETELDIINYLNADANQILAEIIDKTLNIILFDFIKQPLDSKFDFITAFECLASVNSFADFNNAVSNCYQMLNNGGSLLGISTRYIDKTEQTLELIKSGNEGHLNPDVAEYQKAFANAGFKVVTLEKQELKNTKNYNEVVIFNVQK